MEQQGPFRAAPENLLTTEGYRRHCKGAVRTCGILLSEDPMITCCTRTLKLSISLVAAILLGIGCATSNSAFTSLVNQGIVPVSSDNPFVGANLYLAKEMEDSLYLYSFLKSRGAPRAIELRGASQTPDQLSLYYSKTNEVYHATLQLDRISRTKEWIIRGPYAVERDSYRPLSQLGPETSGVFEIFGRREILGGPVRAAESRVIAPAFVPTPAPTPRPHRRKAVVRKHTAVEATGTALPSNPSNLDQEALLEASKRAQTPTVPGTPAAVNPPSPSQKPAAIDHALKETIGKPSPKAEGVK